MGVDKNDDDNDDLKYLILLKNFWLCYYFLQKKTLEKKLDDFSTKQKC